MTDEIPGYALLPLRRCLDSISTIRRLLMLSAYGLQIITIMPRMLEQIYSTPVNRTNTLTGMMKFAAEDAPFTMEERDQGYPNLHAYTLVSTWGALEAGIEDMLLNILVNEPGLLEQDQFAKIKIPLGKFQQLDKEERMRYLLNEVQRLESSGLAQGVNAFENVLHVFELTGFVDVHVRDALWELNHIRNVLVHRDSRADLRLVQACPKLNLKAGERVLINHEKYEVLSEGVIEYVKTVARRLGPRYKANPPAWALPEPKTAVPVAEKIE